MVEGMDTIIDRAVETCATTRPRRIFSCYGDGAKAFPIDPEHLGYAGVGVMPIRADGLEVYFHEGQTRRVVCLLCYAAPGQLSAGTDIGARCNEPPPVWRATRPHDCPRPLRLLRVAGDFVAALHARHDVLAGARIVRAAEAGITEIITVEIRPDALVELRYSYGEPWLHTMHGTIPPLAQDAIRDCWDSARAEDPAQR